MLELTVLFVSSVHLRRSVSWVCRRSEHSSEATYASSLSSLSGSRAWKWICWGRVDIFKKLKRLALSAAVFAVFGVTVVFSRSADALALGEASPKVSQARVAAGDGIKVDANLQVTSNVPSKLIHEQIVSQDGVLAYDAADYEEAILWYEAEIKTNPGNGHLYYNLGNAFFRNSHRGKSIAAYLEARRLLPRNPDIRVNLKFVLAQNKDKLEADLPKSLVRSFSFWVGKVTNRELSYATSILFGLACLLLLPAIFNPRLRFFRRAGYIVGGIAALAAFALSVSVVEVERWGAVTTSLAKVKSGPGEQNTIVFELREGAPFIARRSEKSWYQIELSDGKIGWVSRGDAQVYGM